VKAVHEVKMFGESSSFLKVSAFLAALALTLFLGCASAQGEARLPGTPRSLAYDAATATLWGVSTEGVYRSDSGANWKPVPIDQGTATPVQLFVDLHAGGRLYRIGPELGVLRSNDAGQTWRQIGEGLPSKTVGAFAVNSVEEGTLYAWIPGQGLFRTIDAGTTWDRMDDGPPTVIESLAHSSLPGQYEYRLALRRNARGCLFEHGLFLRLACGGQVVHRAGDYEHTGEPTGARTHVCRRAWGNLPIWRCWSDVGTGA